MNKKLTVIIIVTLLTGVLVGWFIGSHKPERLQEKGHEDHQHQEGAIYTCSMHPQIRSSEEGDCPICGMALVPLSKESKPVDGIKMSMNEMRLGNIRTMIAGSKQQSEMLKLTGKIAPNEKLTFSQSSHIGGRIEKLNVNYEGEFVRKGQVIAYVYSPELVNAEKELFVAQKMSKTQPELFEAAKEKLKNWKLTEQQIESILASGKPKDNFPILSDISGVVIRKNVNPGDHIMQGESLYEIADLTKLWVLLEVYEKDLSGIKVGDEVSYTVKALPGETFTGEITFVDPVIDPVTRVAYARLTVNNQNDTLKPGMYVDAKVMSSRKTGSGKVTVPASAVLWTGERSVVYVAENTNEGKIFDLRMVTLGNQTGEYYTIESGLQEGEEVVVNGTFTVDAAAQLAGKPSMMDQSEEKAGIFGRPEVEIPREKNTGSEQVIEYSETMDVSEDFKIQVRKVFQEYLPIKSALVASSGEETSQHLSAFIEFFDKIDAGTESVVAREAWSRDAEALQTFARKMQSGGDLDEMRKWLSPLSDQLYHSLRRFGIREIGYRQYCPMAFDYKGAFWLSDSEEILNPYFGDEMLTCGNIEEEL